MDIWYSLIDFLLPFEWANADEMLFMKNALLAVLLISPIFGIIGTMVVNNRMAFFSDALGHGAFTGIALGSLIGFVRPLWAAILFSILFAVFITLVKYRTKTSPDTIIGVFSSTAIAAGIFIVSVGQSSFNSYTSYLVGDLLSISPSDILMLMFALLGVVILWTLMFNKFLLNSVNQSLAGSRGVNILTVEITFTAAVAVIVTISIQWVGLLIVNSLLVLPAASARNVSNNIRRYHLLSVTIALISGVTGLIASYYWNSATGATIVLVSALFYFITLVLKNKVG